MRPGLFSLLTKLASDMKFPAPVDYQRFRAGTKNMTIRIQDEIGKYRAGKDYDVVGGRIRVTSVTPVQISDLGKHVPGMKDVQRVLRDNGGVDGPAEIVRFEKLSGLAPSPQHQEFLDNHFTDASTSKWRAFKNKLVSPKFVDAVRQDERADSKLKRYSENNARHMQAKGVPSYRVPSQSSGKSYTVKFHPSVKRFSCNCGDWVHKQSTKGKGGECKHVNMVKRELESQGISKEKQAAIRGVAAASLLEDLLSAS